MKKKLFSVNAIKFLRNRYLPIFGDKLWRLRWMSVFAPKLFQGDSQQSNAEEELDEDERFQHEATPPRAFSTFKRGGGRHRRRGGSFNIV